MEGNLAVIILAAGMSTRFMSSKTKVLHELCGKPMIEWVLDAALPLAPQQLVVVYGTHSIELKDKYAGGYLEQDIDLVLQEPTLGTAHALMTVASVLEPDITHLLVLPGDAPLVRAEELAVLEQALADSDATHAVLSTHVEDPGDLGRVLRSSDRAIVERIIEAHEATDAELTIKEINTGIYLFARSVFDHLKQAAERFGASGSKGEYYLPDVVRVAPTCVAACTGISAPIGVNDRIQLSNAEAVLLERLRQHWMSEGASFHLPETTYLDHDVVISIDAEIGPHCVLTRGTHIGAGTKLVQGCLLETCIIGENCELRHVRGLMSVVEANVTAGPYVNMRPGTILHDGVKVGNFVETKNADIGAGSKLPHLQYVGDATLGERCNIGAGTIFCNYDGIQKHHTTLGADVFTGSNSSIQGGVTLGDGSYIAMGSAITKDVPADALAIARGRQENKLDYVKKLKERLERRKERATAGEQESSESSGG
jgi:bifunctional UDP-N-acetylglucosamine pyrophosphorylase/glucosamine-1-phosphate N-acetyltransferase